MDNVVGKFIVFDSDRGACCGRIVGRSQVNTLEGKIPAFLIEDMMVRNGTQISQFEKGARRLVREDQFTKGCIISADEITTHYDEDALFEFLLSGELEQKSENWEKPTSDMMVMRILTEQDLKQMVERKMKKNEDRCKEP